MRAGSKLREVADVDAQHQDLLVLGEGRRAGDGRQQQAGDETAAADGGAAAPDDAGRWMHRSSPSFCCPDMLRPSRVASGATKT